MVNDLIADSLTRIRNASMRRLEVTTLLYSKIVEAIMKILQEKGYIESYKVVEDGNKKFINVVLKYEEEIGSVGKECGDKAVQKRLRHYSRKHITGRTRQR